MPTNYDHQKLRTYSFREEDIHLITKALRDMARDNPFRGTQLDAQNLLEYTELIHRENLRLEKDNRAFYEMLDRYISGAT